jgi:hypothetical protein
LVLGLASIQELQSALASGVGVAVGSGAGVAVASRVGVGVGTEVGVGIVPDLISFAFRSFGVDD